MRAELAGLTPEAIRALVEDLDPEEAETILRDWELWAREEQLPPAGAWFCWLILAGRGWGKTRTGAEYIRARAESGNYSRFALIGETAADVRDVMVEGESGLLAISHPRFMPKYEPSKRRVTWPNGAMATCYSGDDPEQLRGPQHDTAWADELAKWRYADEAWANMEFGLRLGEDPRVVVTTTPRPIPIILDLMRDPQTVRPTTNLSTAVNRANVSARFVERVVRKYEGTRRGLQELEAQVLTDTPGALWTLEILDRCRVRREDIPAMRRIVVAIDPSVGDADDLDEQDEAGIIAAGEGVDGHGYILADVSLVGPPALWAETAVELFTELQANTLIAERNNGGAMVEHTLRTSVPNGGRLPIETVWASRGKFTRAEPISLLYARKSGPIVHHVGYFSELETELRTFVPGQRKSPNRLDALVWALTALFPNEETKAAGSAPNPLKPQRKPRYVPGKGLVS